MSQQDDGEKLVAIYSVLSVLCSFEKKKPKQQLLS